MRLEAVHRGHGRLCDLRKPEGLIAVKVRDRQPYRGAPHAGSVAGLLSETLHAYRWEGKYIAFYKGSNEEGSSLILVTKTCFFIWTSTQRLAIRIRLTGPSTLS